MFKLRSIAYQKGLYNLKGMKSRIMQILAQFYKSYMYVLSVKVKRS